MSRWGQISYILIKGFQNDLSTARIKKIGPADLRRKREAVTGGFRHLLVPQFTLLYSSSPLIKSN